MRLLQGCTILVNRNDVPTETFSTAQANNSTLDYEFSEDSAGLPDLHMNVQLLKSVQTVRCEKGCASTKATQFFLVTSSHWFPFVLSSLGEDQASGAHLTLRREVEA